MKLEMRYVKSRLALLALGASFLGPAVGVHLVYAIGADVGLVERLRLGRDQGLRDTASGLYRVDRQNYLEGWVALPDGRPIKGAEVLMVDGRHAAADQRVHRTRSDAQGRFIVEACGYGSFDVYFRSPGTVPRRIGDIPISDGNRARLGRTVLEPVSDDRCASVQGGWAVDEVHALYAGPWPWPNRLPVLGDQVLLTSRDPDGWPSALMWLDDDSCTQIAELATTDAGEFVLGPASAIPSMLQIWEASPTDLTERSEASIGDRTGSLQITGPGPFSRIRVMDKTRRVVAEAWCDRFGETQIEGLEPGGLYATGTDRAGKWVQVKGCVVPQKEEGRLRLDQVRLPDARGEGPFSLCGFVFDETGATVPGALVSLLSKDGSREHQPLSKESADENGYYLFPGLIAGGEYRVGISLSSESGDVVRWQQVPGGAEAQNGIVLNDLIVMRTCAEVAISPALARSHTARLIRLTGGEEDIIWSAIPNGDPASVHFTNIAPGDYVIEFLAGGEEIQRVEVAVQPCRRGRATGGHIPTAGEGSHTQNGG